MAVGDTTEAYFLKKLHLSPISTPREPSRTSPPATTITGAPTEQGANVRQVAREMGGANGQGLASSGNAVLDTLRKRKEQQALRSVVVAIAAMLLA